MLESEVYAEFVKSMKKFVHIHRIENAINAGTFDCMVSYANITMWVEFKEDDERTLRDTQVSWAKRRMDFGCFLDMIVITMRGENFIVCLARDLVECNGPINKCKRVEVPRKKLPEVFLHMFFTIRGVNDLEGRDRSSTGVVH